MSPARSRMRRRRLPEPHRVIHVSLWLAALVIYQLRHKSSTTTVSGFGVPWQDGPICSIRRSVVALSRHRCCLLALGSDRESQILRPRPPYSNTNTILGSASSRITVRRPLTDPIRTMMAATEYQTQTSSSSTLDATSLFPHPALPTTSFDKKAKKAKRLTSMATFVACFANATKTAPTTPLVGKVSTLTPQQHNETFSMIEQPTRPTTSLSTTTSAAQTLHKSRTFRQRVGNAMKRGMNVATTAVERGGNFVMRRRHSVNGRNKHRSDYDEEHEGDERKKNMRQHDETTIHMMEKQREKSHDATRRQQTLASTTTGIDTNDKDEMDEFNKEKDSATKFMELVLTKAMEAREADRIMMASRKAAVKAFLDSHKQTHQHKDEKKNAEEEEEESKKEMALVSPAPMHAEMEQSSTDHVEQTDTIDNKALKKTALLSSAEVSPVEMEQKVIGSSSSTETKSLSDSVPTSTGEKSDTLESLGKELEHAEKAETSTLDSKYSPSPSVDVRVVSKSKASGTSPSTPNMRPTLVEAPAYGGLTNYLDSLSTSSSSNHGSGDVAQSAAKQNTSYLDSLIQKNDLRMKDSENLNKHKMRVNEGGGVGGGYLDKLSSTQFVSTWSNIMKEHRSDNDKEEEEEETAGDQMKENRDDKFFAFEMSAQSEQQDSPERNSVGEEKNKESDISAMETDMSKMDNTEEEEHRKIREDFAKLKKQAAEFRAALEEAESERVTVASTAAAIEADKDEEKEKTSKNVAGEGETNDAEETVLEKVKENFVQLEKKAKEFRETLEEVREAEIGVTNTEEEEIEAQKSKVKQDEEEKLTLENQVTDSANERVLKEQFERHPAGKSATEAEGGIFSVEKGKEGHSDIQEATLGNKRSDNVVTEKETEEQPFEELTREALHQKALKQQEQRLIEVAKARQQPKSVEEEKALATRYGAMSLEERAFNILLDLGMIEIHPDPDEPNYDHADDNDFCPENVLHGIASL